MGPGLPTIVKAINSRDIITEKSGKRHDSAPPARPFQSACAIT